MTFDVCLSLLYEFRGQSQIINTTVSNNHNHKLLTLLCPTNAQVAKLTNKFASIIFSARSKIDDGQPFDRGDYDNNNFDSDSDSED